MSKKSLMSNYSESGPMPVMDGLIGWYDARDRDVNDTYLIDKSGNQNDISCESSNCTVHEHYIEVCGGSYSKPMNYSDYINDEFTISYYIEITAYGNQLKCMSGHYKDGLGWWICPRLKQSNVWYKYHKHIDDGDNNKIIFPMNKKIMMTLILTSTKVSMYMNGVLLVCKNITINTPLNLTIGLFSDSGYVNNAGYKYYSSYVYNRSLTEEEIQQNYLYEQSIERG